MLLKPYGPVVSFGYQTIALTGLIIGEVKLIQVAVSLIVAANSCAGMQFSS